MAVAVTHYGGQGATTGMDDTSGPNCQPPNYFDPEWLEDVLWVATRVNRHSVTNKWLTVDETRWFELVMKERKALTTQQCRILVKGAPHLPLQLSTGSSVQFLYPTWQYLKLIEASSAIPDVPPSRYREVEDWMLQHIKEFQDQRLADASSSHYHHQHQLPQPQHTAIGGSASGSGSVGPTTPATPGTLTTQSSTVSLLVPVISSSGIPGMALAAEAQQTKTGVKSRLKDYFNKKTHRSSTPVTPRSSSRPGFSPLDAPGSFDHADSPQSGDDPARSPDAHHKNKPSASKRQAFAAFIRNKLNSADSAQSAALLEAAESDDEHDDDGPPGVASASLGSIGAASSASGFMSASAATDDMSQFRLSWESLSMMQNELRHEHSHATFDRLFRRRRAYTKWEYEHREAILEQIRANRTIGCMVLVGLYTLLMHVVPFDLFCLLLLILEIIVHHVCTNYRTMALDMGRRAARTRVDRVKDWFFFAVTRRKQRQDEQQAAAGLKGKPPTTTHTTQTPGAVVKPSSGTAAAAGPVSPVVTPTHTYAASAPVANMKL
jgi:hypothetical protein